MRPLHLLSCIAWLAALPAAAVTSAPAQFAWQAAIELPAGTAAARLALPADAFMASRTRELADVRILNGMDEPVAFAYRRAAPASTTPVRTASHPAYPLSRAPDPSRGSSGSVQVRVNTPGGEAVWVRMAPGPVGVPPAAGLPAVLFDLRQESGTLQDLVLEGDLPANTPVRITAATSTDLSQWTPLPVQGSVYRFEGAAAFGNRTLPLATPQSLHGRYLRLSWDEQPGVRITGLAGTIGQPAPARVASALPPLREVDGGLEWTNEGASRIAALALSVAQPNSLVPVRLLGRQEAGQPWRELARAAVYRVGAAGSESTNPPIPLGTALRHLRVEPGVKDLRLPPLSASVEFDAVELVFLATGRGPFRLVTGRAATAPGDLPLATLAAAVPHPDDLPAARLGPSQAKPAPAPSLLAGVFPDLAPTTLVLWAVLCIGVLVLALVAWRVLAQVNAGDGTGRAES